MENVPPQTQSNENTETENDHPEHRPENGLNSQERPCGCKGPDPHTETKVPKRPWKCRTKKPDCCEYLLEVLKQLPDFERLEIHKPKQSNTYKVSCRCENVVTRDSLIPIFFMLLKKHLSGSQPLNDFEYRVFDILRDIPNDGIAALRSSLEAYEAMPEDMRNCLFNPDVVNWPRDRAIDPATLIELWVEEGLMFVADILAPKNGGTGEPGKARPWSQTTPPQPDGVPATTTTAPYPWICAIIPDISRPEFRFRNREWFPEATDLQPHEFAATCTYNYSPTQNQVIETCVRQKAPANPPFGGGVCEGGPNYTTLDYFCLTIVPVFPGDEIALKGFNFFSPDCTVNMNKIDGGTSVFNGIKAKVFGDLERPLTDSDGKPLADCLVEDVLVFSIPRTAQVGGGPFEPGLYEIEVEVPNTSNVPAVDSSGYIWTPSRYKSNKVLLRVQPPVDLTYQIGCDWARCYSETDGLGSDEVWMKTGVATFRPSAGEGIKAINLVMKNIFEDDDIDSGDYISGVSAEIFNDRLERFGAVAFGIIGLEVDDEAVARAQLKSWWDAFSYAFEQIWAAALSLITSPLAANLFAGFGWAAAGIASGVIAAVILAAMAIWATWARADRIALDWEVKTPSQMFDLTNATKPLPPIEEQRLEDIDRKILPLEKQGPANAAAKTYVAERQYHSEDEDSLYGLRLKYGRV